MKLDIYHAIQRPLKKISKKHPYRSDFSKELGLIIRQGDDIGDQRKKMTPQPEEINKNIDRFLQKWEQIEYKGWFIVTDSVRHEFENLKQHVNKGK